MHTAQSCQQFIKLALAHSSSIRARMQVILGKLGSFNGRCTVYHKIIIITDKSHLKGQGKSKKTILDNAACLMQLNEKRLNYALFLCHTSQSVILQCFCLSVYQISLCIFCGYCTLITRYTQTVNCAPIKSGLLQHHQ